MEYRDEQGTKSRRWRLPAWVSWATVVGIGVELVMGGIELYGNYEFFGGMVAFMGALFLLTNLAVAISAIVQTKHEDQRLAWWAGVGAFVLMIFGVWASLVWYQAATDRQTAISVDRGWKERQALYLADVKRADAAYASELKSWSDCGRLVRCGTRPSTDDHPVRVPDPGAGGEEEEKVTMMVKGKLRKITGAAFALSVALAIWLARIGKATVKGVLTAYEGVNEELRREGDSGIEVVRPIDDFSIDTSPSPLTQNSQLGDIQKPMGVVGDPLGPPKDLSKLPRIEVGSGWPPKELPRTPTVDLGTELDDKLWEGTYYICNGRYRLKKKKGSGWDGFFTSPPGGTKRDLGYIDHKIAVELIELDGSQKDPKGAEDALWEYLAGKGKVRPMWTMGADIIPIIRTGGNE